MLLLKKKILFNNSYIYSFWKFSYFFIKYKLLNKDIKFLNFNFFFQLDFGIFKNQINFKLLNYKFIFFKNIFLNSKFFNIKKLINNKSLKFDIDKNKDDQLIKFYKRKRIIRYVNLNNFYYKRPNIVKLFYLKSKNILTISDNNKIRMFKFINIIVLLNDRFCSFLKKNNKFYKLIRFSKLKNNKIINLIPYFKKLSSIIRLYKTYLYNTNFVIRIKKYYLSKLFNKFKFNIYIKYLYNNNFINDLLLKLKEKFNISIAFLKNLKNESFSKYLNYLYQLVSYYFKSLGYNLNKTNLNNLILFKFNSIKKNYYLFNNKINNNFFIIDKNKIKLNYRFRSKSMFLYKRLVTFFLKVKYRISRKLYFSRLSLILKDKIYKTTKNKVKIYFFFLKSNYRTASVLGYFFVRRLQHRYSLTFVSKTVMKALERCKNIKGVTFKCSGRFSRKQRAVRLTIFSLKKKLRPLNTFTSLIDYSFNIAYLRNGSCGIKIWIVLKDPIFKNLLFSVSKKILKIKKFNMFANIIINTWILKKII